MVESNAEVVVEVDVVRMVVENVESVSVVVVDILVEVDKRVQCIWIWLGWRKWM